MCGDSVRDEFWGAFGILRKATFSFVMTARPSVRIEKLYSQWKGVYEI